MLKRKDVALRMDRHLAMRGIELNAEEYGMAMESLAKCNSVEVMDKRIDMVIGRIGFSSLKGRNSEGKRAGKRMKRKGW